MLKTWSSNARGPLHITGRLPYTHDLATGTHQPIWQQPCAWVRLRPSIATISDIERVAIPACLCALVGRQHARRTRVRPSKPREALTKLQVDTVGVGDGPLRAKFFVSHNLKAVETLPTFSPYQSLAGH
eukprot:COSAG01_NODE_58_length_30193_cov_12.302020_16_plen_129_part_00